MDDDGVGGPSRSHRACSITVAGDAHRARLRRHRPAGAGRHQRRLPRAPRHGLLRAQGACSIPTSPPTAASIAPSTVDRARGHASSTARPPAPVAWRTQTCQRIADLVLGALAAGGARARDRRRATARTARVVFSGTDPTTGQLLRLPRDDRRRLRRAAPPRTAWTACRCTSPTRRTCRSSAWRWSIRCSSRSTRWSPGFRRRRPLPRRAGHPPHDPRGRPRGDVPRDARAPRVPPLGLFGGRDGRRGRARSERRAADAPGAAARRSRGYV